MHLHPSVLLLLTPLTLALPQQTPSYPLSNPPDEISLHVYTSNATSPCTGHLALQYESPLPQNQTACIAGIPGAPSLSHLSCVVSTKKDNRLNKCQMWGFLNTKCEGTPLIAGLNGTVTPKVAGGAAGKNGTVSRNATKSAVGDEGGEWVWGVGTGKVANVQSFVVACSI